MRTPLILAYFLFMLPTELWAAGGQGGPRSLAVHPFNTVTVDLKGFALGGTNTISGEDRGLVMSPLMNHNGKTISRSGRNFFTPPSVVVLSLL